MKGQRHRGMLAQILGRAAQVGFQRAYDQIRIDERRYLRQVKRAHHLPIDSWSDMFLLGPEVVNPIARDTIRAASKLAALEGMGLGIGGFLTVVPDMGILAAITLRMLQKLSLLHGFEFRTEEENISLWLAAASAAGVDIGRSFLEKQAVERLVPRIIDRMAVKVGADVAEKWAGRIVPVVSAGAAGLINYHFVRTWGHRAQKHFLARHLAVIHRHGFPRVANPSGARLLAASSTV
ncbi:MAG TPA: EcsC family protein [Candidatus Acidoferrales bacterium]|nr:EcsC family protein [Candidatus Acidoferrales bacterium]